MIYLDLHGLDLLGIADELDKVGGVLGQQDEDWDQRQDQHVGRVQLLAKWGSLIREIVFSIGFCIVELYQLITMVKVFTDRLSCNHNHYNRVVRIVPRCFDVILESYIMDHRRPSYWTCGHITVYTLGPDLIKLLP